MKVWNFGACSRTRATSLAGHFATQVYELADPTGPFAVSYTHLTLPTNREV